MKALDKDRDLANYLLKVVEDWDNNRPRSTQVTLGPSELGGCREYLRSVIMNEPGLLETGFKAAAFMGTAVGDLIENVFGERLGATLQHEVWTKLPRTNVTIAGSADAIIPAQIPLTELPDGLRRIIEGGFVLDVKSKDGLAEVERYGTSLENLIQVAVYLVGAVREGLLDEESYGVLLYVDRSGNDKRFSTSTMDYEEALRWLDLAEDRLMDVQEVIARGSQEEEKWGLRDKAPSWCFAVQCPFRENCWGGSEHRPTGKIEHPDEVDAINRYVAGRDLEKEAASLKKSAYTDLVGISGITETGTTVTWTPTGRMGPDDTPMMRLDVRVKR